MKIQVTQQHIDSGVRGSCTSDPIALALLEAGFTRPWVGVHYIDVYGRSGGCVKQSANAPNIVYEFLKLYDNGLPTFGPFEFEIDLE